MSQPFSVQFGSIPTYCFSRFLITQLWGRYLLNVSFLLFFFLRTGNASETFLGFCMGFFQSAVGIHPDAAEAHGSHCQVQLAVWMGLFWLPVYPAPWQCVRFLMWLKRMAHRAIVDASSFIFCSIGTETRCEPMVFFSIPLCSGKVWGCLFFFLFFSLHSCSWHTLILFCHHIQCPNQIWTWQRNRELMLVAFPLPSSPGSAQWSGAPLLSSRASSSPGAHAAHPRRKLPALLGGAPLFRAGPKQWTRQGRAAETETVGFVQESTQETAVQPERWSEDKMAEAGFLKTF